MIYIYIYIVYALVDNKYIYLSYRYDESFAKELIKIYEEDYLFVTYDAVILYDSFKDLPYSFSINYIESLNKELV